MNTRRSKRRNCTKRGFKTKTKDGETEVFVLPPDLLIKLGINLKSVGSSQEESNNVTNNCNQSGGVIENKLKDGVSNEPDSHDHDLSKIISESSTENNVQRDSSIIETANLMKKSVFLSPTFVTDSINIDPGEIEISNFIDPNNYVCNESTEIKYPNTIEVAVQETVPEINNFAISIQSQPSDTKVSNSENASNYFKCETFFSPLAAQEHNQINHGAARDIAISPFKVESTDDHADEAYLSDCSNSNSVATDAAAPAATVDNTPEVKAVNCRTPNKLQKKVEIISEELISCSKLKDFEIKPNFIPISANCVLNSKHFEYNLNKEVNAPIVYNINRMHNGNREDFVELYDEEATAAELNKNNTNNSEALTDIKIDDLSLITDQIENAKKQSSTQPCTPENSFGDLDLVVINMVIGENEDILENFANEMTSNDDNILEKIEQSEKDSPTKTNHEPNLLHINNQHVIDLQSIQIESIPIEINVEKHSKEVYTNVDHNNIMLESNNSESNVTEDIPNVYKSIEPENVYLENQADIIQPDFIYKQQNGLSKIQLHKDGLNNNLNCSKTSLFETDFIVKEKNTIEDQPNSPDENMNSGLFMAIRNPEKSIDFESVGPNIASNQPKDTINKSGNKKSENHKSIVSDFIIEKSKTLDCLPLKTKPIQESFDLRQLEDHTIRDKPREIKECVTFVATNTTVDDVVKNNIIADNVTAKASHNSDLKKYDNSSDDKIQEIAMYLSQFARNKSRSVNLRRKSEKNVEMSTKRLKHNPLTNKLCIQGVEKPGGSEKSNEEVRVNKNIKTYRKLKKHDKPLVSTSVPVISSKKYQELCVTVNELDNYSSIIEIRSRKTEFCLCSDFGRLASYDSSYPYEHIHFWEHKLVECDLETIFDIYSDSSANSTHNNEALDFPENETSKTSDQYLPSICWNSCKRVTAENDTKSNISAADLGTDSNKQDAMCNISAATGEDYTAKPEQICVKVLNSKRKLLHEDLKTNEPTTIAEVGTSQPTRHEQSVETPQFKNDQSGTKANPQNADKNVLHKKEKNATADGNTNKQTNLHECALNENNIVVVKTEKSDSVKQTDKPYMEKLVNKKITDESIPLKRKTDTHRICKAKTDVSRRDNSTGNLDRSNKRSTLEGNSDCIAQNTPADNTVTKKAKKRKIIKLEDEIHELSNKKAVKCDVCKNILPVSEWDSHISIEHCFIAWKCGSSFDFHDPCLLKNLKEKVKTSNLKCTFCSLEFLRPKKFLKHVQKCLKKLETSSETTTEISINESTEDDTAKNIAQSDSKTAEQTADNPSGGRAVPDDVISKCGRCKETVVNTGWMEHMIQKHEYIAWKDGDDPLDLEDEEEVRLHLMNVVREIGQLKCSKCGITRKYPKSYMHHIKYCTGSEVLKTLATISDSIVKKETVDSSTSNTKVKCGVCAKEVWSEKWIQHIGKAHNYMAWKEGESLNLDNEEEVSGHLYEIGKKIGHFVCSKCGLVRKSVKRFFQHTKDCDAEPPADTGDASCETSEANRKNICAICAKDVDPKKWNLHKMEKHYNVAWIVGSTPLEIRNPNVIDSLIKEYFAKYKKMVCRICGASRASRIGFYAHVLACGKTEEELEVHKSLCNICDKKYLTIYHSQHMAWHTQQVYSKERKLKEEQNLKLKQEEGLKKETEGEEPVSGRRRAAVKARNIIENIKKEEFPFQCINCKFGSDSKIDLAKHICRNKEDKDFSASEQSSSADDGSGDESEDSIAGEDAALADEHVQDAPRRRSKGYPASQSQRYKHVPKNLVSFLTKAGAEFIKHHLVSEEVYPDLRVFACEPVPADRVHEYLPTLTESCQVQLCDSNWKTFQRFETELKKIESARNVSEVPCYTIFTGGCIQCVSWAPPGSAGDEPGGCVLAVAAHRGADIPRMMVDDTATHPGLIQLWDFGDFTKEAEFVFGLAHDYGTAWAMDWCPSGARDEYPDEPTAGNVLRLGLLAVAFSCGRVVVYSVPYPSTIVKRDKLIQTLTPAVELRMTSNPGRKIYQATSISWSKQKPYECILVGYGDGSTAYFDLNTGSQFLRATENDIAIVYPYHDERLHNTSITGVDLYPSVGSATTVAACGVSTTGGTLAARGGARPARQLTHTALGGAAFPPLWPCAALLGDDANMTTSVNELEWYGGGRRMGGGGAGAGCLRRGWFVFAASPLLRIRYPHPADNQARREVLAVVEMKSLIKKREKLANDELQTKVEPMTYEDAIKKYGIELRMDKESVCKPREAPERCPERFPLAEVNSLAFCPEKEHYKSLAVGTHSGLLFVLKT